MLIPAGIEARLEEMPAGTRTACDAARAVGCDLDQIVKSIVLVSPKVDKHCLFLAAGGSRIDFVKASVLAGAELIQANASEVRARTGYSIGGVLPVAHRNPPSAFFDPKLGEFGIVWSAAGTPRHVFAVDPGILRKLAEASEGDFAQ